jgi:hypothetical protein
MNVTNFTVKRTGKEWMGDAVARALRNLDGYYTVIAIIPRILTKFGNQDEYEVTEVDLLVRYE